MRLSLWDNMEMLGKRYNYKADYQVGLYTLKIAQNKVNECGTVLKTFTPLLNKICFREC